MRDRLKEGVERSEMGVGKEKRVWEFWIWAHRRMEWERNFPPIHSKVCACQKHLVELLNSFVEVFIPQTQFWAVGIQWYRNKFKVCQEHKTGFPRQTVLWLICIIPLSCSRRRKEEIMNPGDVSPDSFITKKEPLNTIYSGITTSRQVRSTQVRGYLDFLRIYFSLKYKGERDEDEEN